MSSTKFTPGPWTLRSPKRFGGALGDAGDFAIVAHSNEIVAEAFERDTTGQSLPSAANAHLIAAAPELYEALEELLSACLTNITLRESASHRSLARDAARCALKKARGE